MNISFRKRAAGGGLYSRPGLVSGVAYLCFVAMYFLPALVFADLSTGMVLHYDFNGVAGTNVTDLSGSGNAGMMNDAVWLPSGGLAGGGAVEFNGTSSYVRAIASASLNVCTQFTISAWFNVSNDLTHRPVMEWSKGQVGVAPGVHMWLYVPTWGSGANVMGQGGTSHLAGFAERPSVGQWHHLVVSYDRSTGMAVAYLDGLLKGTYSLGVFTPEVSYDFYVGHRPLSSSFLGRIDEVRVYSRVLSAMEVWSLYSVHSSNSSLLQITGAPQECGTPHPLGYGQHEIVNGAVVTNSVASPVVGLGFTNVCTGWIGTGDVPSSGSGTSVVFTVTTNSTLTWTWELHEASSLVRGLVLYYNMDNEVGNEVEDLSGRGNDGALSEGSWCPGQGVSGGACRFDGTGTYVKALANTTLNVSTQFTLSAWFNTSIAVPHQPIMEWSQALLGVKPGVHMWINVPTWGSGANVMQQGGEYHFAGFPDGISLGTWHHLVVTYDITTGQAVSYLDGTRKGLYSIGAFVPETRYDLYIGHRPYSSSFSGLIDEVRIYNRALSESEVDLLHDLHDSGRVVVQIDGSPGEIGSPYPMGYGIHEVVSGQVVTSMVSSPIICNGYTNECVGWTGTGDVPASGAGTCVVFSATVNSKLTWLWRSSHESCLMRGLVLHYGFGEENEVSVPDLSGCGNPGYINGGRWVANGGIDGGCYELDGTGSYIRALASSSLNVATQFTLAAWVNVRSDWTHQPVVEWNNGILGASVGVHMWVYVPTWGTGANIVQKGGVNHFAGYSGGPDAGVWHHLAVTYDSITGRSVTYLDGASRCVHLLGSFVPETSHDLYIGKRPYSALFWGKIDEVRIYNRALEGDEIFLLYSDAATNKVELQVAGNPEAYSTSLPLGYGVHDVPTGSLVVESVESPVIANGISRECLGWIGTGSVPAGGSSTSVTFIAGIDSTLVWQWRTSYRLDVLAGDGGNVDVGGGWYSNGATVVATAIPDVDHEFSMWVGNVSPEMATLNPLCITVDRARSVKAIFGMRGESTGDVMEFVVGGIPDCYGKPVPHGYGTNSVVLGSVQTNSVVSQIVTAPGVRVVCSGWTGSGDIPLNGTGRSVVFSVTTNSGITWRWKSEYLLDVESVGGGSVSVPDGWYSNGTPVQITATAGSGFQFVRWVGDVPVGLAATNPLPLIMDRPRMIAAEFDGNAFMIAGRVCYGGGAEGKVQVEVFADEQYVTRVAYTRIDSPGAYCLTNVPGGGVCHLRAFMDTDMDGSLDGNEPAGSYARNPVDLTASLAGIDIGLQTLGAPGSVVAGSVADGILIAWAANPEPGIAGYNIYKFDSPQQLFRKINTAPVVGLEYLDRTVGAGETCYYYITAVILSDFMSGYMESPPSSVVGANPDSVAVWMPDYHGNTGATVRLRINIGNADGVLGNNLALAVTYDPSVLTPVSQVDADLDTVEKTTLTRNLVITDNGLTATGLVEIATAGDVSTNATLRILGCSYEFKSRPVPIEAKYVADFTTNWVLINDGKNINDGGAYSVDIGYVSDGTNCVLNIKELGQNRERQSDRDGDYVMVLRNGDTVGIPGVSNREDMSYALQGCVDGDLRVQIGESDALYLFELGNYTNGVSADYQDVVALVEINHGAALSGYGHLFDVVFHVTNTAAYGRAVTNTIASVDLFDQSGCRLIVDRSDTATFTVSGSYILGDINGDGIVNVNGDFALAMKIAVGQRGPTSDELMAGDIDGDGLITKADATLIKRIIQNLPINPGGNAPEPVYELEGYEILSDIAGAGDTDGGYETQSDTAPSGYELSIGVIEAEAGAVVEVPVHIDNAAGIACVDMRVNFDGGVLALCGVTNTPLTAAFGLEYRPGAGYVEIVMSSSNSLLSGSGDIVTITFRVAASSGIGSLNDITISRLGLGDEYGADLGWSSGICVAHGVLAIVYSAAEDGDNDGLSDYDEQRLDGVYSYNPLNSGNPYGTDGDISNPDTDGDGMKDGDEDYAGTSLVDPESLLEVSRISGQEGGSFMLIWPSVPGKTYAVDVAPNPAGVFCELVGGLAGSGTTNIYVDHAAADQPSRIYRVRVE